MAKEREKRENVKGEGGKAEQEKSNVAAGSGGHSENKRTTREYLCMSMR